MRQIFHITNGDYLTNDLKKIPIVGEIIVCREALVSGDLKSESLEEFWKVRAKSISEDYNVSEENYFEKSVSEFEKILKIPEGSEVNLWFEDDLFCQVNLWFCITLLTNKNDLKSIGFSQKIQKKIIGKAFLIVIISHWKTVYIPKFCCVKMILN